MNKELRIKNLTKYFRGIWNFISHHKVAIIALELAIFFGVVFTFASERPISSTEQAIEMKAEVAGEFNPSPILNPHSYPKAGDHWTISFNTPEGMADLVIIPNDQATIDDLDFISLTCDDEKITPQILANDIIFYPNWSCQGTGEITHLVKIAGKHTLKFQFGDKIAYAYNSPDSQGPNSPGTVADDATIGTIVWNNPNNAKVSDNVYVTPNGDCMVADEITHYLKATNFGFSISSGATINGILVEIEKKSAGTRDGKDYEVKIVKSDGTIGTTNKADTVNNWSWTESYIPYGSSADLWGETWTYSDISDSDFGVVLSAKANSEPAPACFIPWVDHIRITVYYTPAPSWQPRPPAVQPGGSGGFFIF